MDGVLVVIF